MIGHILALNLVLNKVHWYSNTIYHLSSIDGEEVYGFKIVLHKNLYISCYRDRLVMFSQFGNGNIAVVYRFDL